MSVISYPTPPYSNPAIHPAYYNPSRYNISAITKGITTVVTTSSDHDYVVGQNIRMIIPPDYGMRELNGVSAYVISLPADDQVELDIDSRDFNAFTDPSTGAGAQIISIGDINSGYIATNGINIPTQGIPGSFINVS